MIFLAFAFGLWLGIKRARKVGIESDAIMDFVVWIMISSLVGARLTYVIFNWGEFAARPLDAISPFQSDGSIGIAGLVVLGGVAFAIPAAAIFAKRRKIPFWRLVDVMTPSLAFGLAIGRVGCFLNGCCFGLPTHQPWGVLFPKGAFASIVFPGEHVHPTQIYDFIYNSLIALVLLWYTPRRRFEGELFALFLVIYGMMRIWVEALRYYEPSGIPFTVLGVNVTGSMIGSAVMIAGGIYLFLKPPTHRIKHG